MLSAKLYEDKIVFIDTEEISVHKTQVLEEIISPFRNDKLCFLTSSKINENFQRAASNLSLLKLKSPHKFHVPDLLTNDYIFITKQGLIELESIIEARHENNFRNKKAQTAKSIEKWKERKIDPFEKSIILPIRSADKLEGFDPKKPTFITTDALTNYMQDLKAM